MVTGRSNPHAQGAVGGAHGLPATAPYVWIVSNRKPEARRGKVRLIDASGMWRKMRRSLGSKRKELAPEHIQDITRIFSDFAGVTAEFLYRSPTMAYPFLRRDSEGGGSTKGAITCKDIADLVVAVPPMHEQLELGAWLRHHESTLTALDDSTNAV